MFYITLFFSFLYFKIYRVRMQQEKVKPLVKVVGLFTNILSIILIIIGLFTQPWYGVLLASMLFFIMAALMIAAVQLGVFVDGKPVLVLGHIYKLTPVITLLILLGTVATVIL